MSINIHELAHPESLSESALLEILKNRCIEIPNVKALRKSELVEMFKRVSLPLPQRRYNEAKYLGKKLNDLRVNRKITIAVEEEQALYESIVSSQSNSPHKSDSGRLKVPCDSTENTPSKKMRFSNSSPGTNGLPENGLKRKINDTNVSGQSEVKKRQKITWP